MNITTMILMKTFEFEKDSFRAEKAGPCAVCGRPARFIDVEFGVYAHEKCLPQLWERCIASTIKA